VNKVGQGMNLPLWLQDTRLVSRTGIGALVGGIGFVMAVKPLPVVFGVAALLAVAGAVVRFWAAGIISKNRELATGGPYAWVRNPLYFGSFLIMVAFLLLNGNPWYIIPAVVGTSVIYVRTIRSETAMLTELFGETYREYCRRVPALIPWRGRVGMEGGSAVYSLEQSLFNKEYNGALGTLAMLAAFYLYLHWIPETAFRVGSALVLVGYLVFRGARTATRSRRTRQAMQQSGGDPVAGTPDAGAADTGAPDISAANSHTPDKG